MSSITAFKNPNSVMLKLNNETVLDIPVRAAFGLMMMATGISWSTEKLTQYEGRLNSPFAFEPKDNAWPTQYSKEFSVVGNGVAAQCDAPYENLWFIMGPHVDQTIEVLRVDVLRALNNFFVGIYGEDLRLQDSYDVANLDPEIKYIPSGVDGVLLGVKSYVNFVRKVGSEHREITNLQFFTSNQNCTRPAHVEKLCFVTDVYTGGYHGKEVAAAIEYHIGQPNEMMLEV